ncbi:MAG: hypothetical protein LBK58_12380 [Prevotellaceae bacterium]|jgi:hypothetical protein|nr:hypothetical protein [Prevotellaceae bacterium]
MSLLNTYHQSDKTPLWRFVDAMKGKTRALRRFPLPFGNTGTALMMLYDDYGVLSGSRHYRNEIDRLKNVMTRNNRIVRLEIAIHTGDSRLMRKLTGSDNVSVAAGTLKLWLHEYEQTPENQSPEQNGGGFESAITEISKYMGFRIDPKSVTVAEFASMIKKYGEELKAKTKTKRL